MVLAQYCAQGPQQNESRYKIMNTNTNVNTNLNGLVAEVANLNRQLLLLQIEELENEIIPCQHLLEQLLSSRNLTAEGNSNARFKNLPAKIALLRSLREELNQTDRLAIIAVGRMQSRSSDC